MWKNILIGALVAALVLVTTVALAGFAFLTLHVGDVPPTAGAPAPAQPATEAFEVERASQPAGTDVPDVDPSEPR